MTDPRDVVVVGSCMIDLVCYAPRLPKAGETLRGTRFQTGFGGKGCNQCVASKKLGADCLLVARIGNDSFGKNYYDKLNQYEIPTKFVKITEGVSTGMAQITVADTGENQIVIVLGANEKLSETDVEEAADVIAQCKVLLCQMEITESTTIKALQIKHNSKIGKSIFNAAPARSDLNPLLFSLPNIFCVNETEAEIITGIEIKTLQDVEKAMGKLFTKGCREVIITLGEQGACYKKLDSSDFVHVPALEVNAVDTTGAGDAFVGALACFLASQPDLSMKELIRKANTVASISVQKFGTQIVVWNSKMEINELTLKHGGTSLVPL